MIQIKSLQKLGILLKILQTLGTLCEWHRLHLDSVHIVHMDYVHLHIVPYGLCVNGQNPYGTLCKWTESIWTMCRVYPKLKTKTKLKIKIKTKITNTKTFTWLGRLRPTPGFVDNTWLSKNTNVHQPPMPGF